MSKRKKEFYQHDTNGDGEMDQEDLARWESAQESCCKRFMNAGFYRNAPTCKDFKNTMPCSQNLQHAYNAPWIHSYGSAFVVLSGQFFKIFTWTLWLQAVIMVTFVWVLGYNMCDDWQDNASKYCYPMVYGNPPAAEPTANGLLGGMNCVVTAGDTCFEWFNSGEGIAKSLVSFVLAGFIGNALAQTYYANRGLSTAVFNSTMGLSSLIASYVRSSNPEDDAEVREIHQLLVRWAIAAFRLIFHLNRSEVSCWCMG